MTTHQILLVPGFFGFEALGNLRYFEGVSDLLRDGLKRQGFSADVRELNALPTASIRQRAAAVLVALSELMEAGDGPIHIIGHSTGGLDARVALAPTASLPCDVDQKAVFERVQTLVTVSTPHRGTPLATFFAGAAGQPLLKLVAVTSAALLNHGKVPLRVAIKLGEIFSSVDDYVGLKNTTLDEIYRELLSDFTDERRKEITKLLDEVAKDQSLVFQLTPAGIDLLNTTTADPEGVRYASVITHAKKPDLSSVRKLGLKVYAQSLHAVFSSLYGLTSRVESKTVLHEAHEAALRSAYSYLPADSANDGVVPTTSQAWGEVIAAVWGDHLDVVGHFGDGSGTDWLPSLSGFDSAAFADVWTKVANFIAEDRRVETAPQEVRGLPATGGG